MATRIVEKRNEFDGTPYFIEEVSFMGIWCETGRMDKTVKELEDRIINVQHKNIIKEYPF